jgi:hypothetical protein
VVLAACLGTRATGQSVNRIPAPRHRTLVSYTPPVDLTSAFALGEGREAVGEAMTVIGTALAAHVAATEARTGIVLPER